MSTKAPPKSLVWQHFNKRIDEAECNYCMAVLKCKGSSTTGLARHILVKHGIQIKQDNNSMTDCQPFKKIKTAPSISDAEPNVDNKCNLKETLAKLVAVDDIPVKTIINSFFIRKSLLTQGLVLPQSESEILRLVFEYHDEVKQNIIAKYQYKKLENMKFCLSLDEITSCRARSYIAIFVRYTIDDFNMKDCIGLVRVNDYRNAEEVTQWIKAKLKEFDLNLEEDILVSTTDDTILMQEFNFTTTTLQQLCYNQAISLTAREFLYDYNLTDSFSTNSDDEVDLLDASFEISACKKLNIPNGSIPAFNKGIGEYILKVREIVRFFKQTPEYNIILQEYVVEDYGEEISLVMDNPLKWNTLENMLSKFLHIKTSILKALQKLNRIDLWFEKDIENLNEIHQIIELLRISIEALNRSDMNLLSSEGVFKFLFSSLERIAINHVNLLSYLKSNVQKRRTKEMVSLFKYLQNPQILQEPIEDTFFEIVPKTSLVCFANQTLHRIGFNNFVQTNDLLESNIKIEHQTLTSTSKLERELEQSISKCYERKSLKTTKIDNYERLLQEFNIYEVTGTLTPNLQSAYDSLKSISPTSVNINKIFLSTNYKSPEICDHINLKTMNIFFLLKNHFANLACSN